MIIMTNVTMSMVILVIVMAFWFWAEPSKILGPQLFMCLHQLCFVASQKFAFFPTNGLETLKGPVVPHLKFRSSDPRATGRTTWESVRPPEQTSATSPQPSDHLKGSDRWSVAVVGQLVGRLVQSKSSPRFWVCVSVRECVWASNRRGRNCAVSDSSPNK